MTYVDLHPEIRTPNCLIPYPKLLGPVPQTAWPLDRHRRCCRSPRIGSPRRHRLPASELTTEPGGRMPPGPGPFRWIRTITLGRPGRRARPAASVRGPGGGSARLLPRPTRRGSDRARPGAARRCRRPGGGRAPARPRGGRPRPWSSGRWRAGGRRGPRPRRGGRRTSGRGGPRSGSRSRVSAGTSAGTCGAPAGGDRAGAGPGWIPGRLGGHWRRRDSAHTWAS